MAVKSNVLPDVPVSHTDWNVLQYASNYGGVSCQNCALSDMDVEVWHTNKNYFWKYVVLIFFTIYSLRKLILNYKENTWKVPMMELMFSNFAVFFSVHISVATSVNFLFCASLSFSIKTYLLQKELWSFVYFILFATINLANLT